MVTGNSGLGSPKMFVRETKITLYRLHPNEFGKVMVMPNLPAGIHEMALWQKKGYKTDPESLMPGAKLEKTPGGGLFLVPDGYKFESYQDTVKHMIDKTEFTETVWRVVKEEKSPIVEETKEEVAPLYVSEKKKSKKKSKKK